MPKQNVKLYCALSDDWNSVFQVQVRSENKNSKSTCQFCHVSMPIRKQLRCQFP